jgi:hypothetical protein
MKNLKEGKQRLVEGLLDFIWKKSVAGKERALVAMYDHDPEVAAAIKDLNKSKDGLLSAIEKSKSLRNSK